MSKHIPISSVVGFEAKAVSAGGESGANGGGAGGSAAQSAEAARRSAEAAKRSANEAQIAAASTSGSANAAAADADRAAQSALEAANSAANIRFGYATRAELPTLTTDDTGRVVNVTNDPVAANNGAWRWDGATWVQTADRTTQLAEAEAATRAAFDGLGLTGLDVYQDLGIVSQTVRDASGRLRVLSRVSDSQAVSFYAADAVTQNGATQALSYGGASEVYTALGVAYPAQAEYVRDASGRLRVVLALGNGFEFLAGADPVPAPADTLPTTFYVVCCIGQSNMEGRGTASASPVVPEGAAYWWDSVSASLRQVVDPVEDATTGSSLPSMCLEFWKRTGFGLVLVPAAQGGAALTQQAATGAGQGTNNWSATGVRRAQASARYAACVEALDAAGICWQNGGVVCSVGETDGSQLDAEAPGLTAQVYYDTYVELIDYMRVQTGAARAPFVVARTGAKRSGDTTGWAQVRSQQEAVVRNLDTAFLGFTGALAFPARGLMADELHYNQAGLNEMGRAMGATLAAVALGKN